MEEIIAISLDYRVITYGQNGKTFYLQERKNYIFHEYWFQIDKTTQEWVFKKWIEEYGLRTEEDYSEEETEDDGLYHVYTTNDGIKLYAKEKVAICNCNDSLHRLGIGCL